MIPVAPISPAEAIARLRHKRLFPTALSSAELAGLPQALTERSFFSARNTLTGSLDVMQQMAESILNPTQERRADRVTPENPEGFVTTGFDQASARLAIKDTFDQLGYTPVPGEAGTIKDLSSDARINLVLDMNVSEAQAYGHLLQNADPDFADAFPAQELVRTGERKEPRDWAVLWQSAAAEAGDAAAARAHRQHGRMVARKDSAIWRKLSRFDRAWPPFDYGSGMGLEDTTREEAMDLGVIDRDTQVAVNIPRFEGEPT